MAPRQPKLNQGGAPIDPKKNPREPHDGPRSPTKSQNDQQQAPRWPREDLKNNNTMSRGMGRLGVLGSSGLTVGGGSAAQAEGLEIGAAVAHPRKEQP